MGDKIIHYHKNDNDEYKLDSKGEKICCGLARCIFDNRLLGWRDEYRTFEFVYDNEIKQKRIEKYSNEYFDIRDIIFDNYEKSLFQIQDNFIKKIID